MDLKALGKDLNALQSRVEFYEDAVTKGYDSPKDIQQHNLESLAYYRAETSKVRAKYLELIQLVKGELDK